MAKKDLTTHEWIPFNQKNRKPTVLLDCDGPLADFVKAALDLYFEETNERVDPEDIKTWDIFESVSDDKVLRDKVYDKLKAEGQCLSFAVQPGSQEGVARLKEISEVIVVTSPWFNARTWVWEREKWLEKLFDMHSHDIIHARDKFHIAGDFLVDDKTSHIRDWQTRFPQGQGLLWTMSYNRQDPHKRVSSWDELIQIVRG